VVDFSDKGTSKVGNYESKSPGKKSNTTGKKQLLASSGVGVIFSWCVS
jgi:hypothetical protein